jgi:hypothetical protein
MNGVDMLFSRNLGWHVQDRLQEKISTPTRFSLQWLIEGIQI